MTKSPIPSQVNYGIYSTDLHETHNWSMELCDYLLHQILSMLEKNAEGFAFVLNHEKSRKQETAQQAKERGTTQSEYRI